MASQEQVAELYNRVFFSKLAAAGVHPDTEGTAQDLLDLAGHSRKVAEAQGVRTSNNVAANAKLANAQLAPLFNGEAALAHLRGV